LTSREAEGMKGLEEEKEPEEAKSERDLRK
jgi:hypothetical protein